MKRFLAVVFLSLLVVQLCLLPMAVNGTINGGSCPSVVTLPATNITDSTATLNGSVTIPSYGRLTTQDGVVLASLQHTSNPNPNTTVAYVSFKYGTVPGVYTNETAEVAMSLPTGTFPFQASVSGLTTCTTYYARTKIHSLILLKYNQHGGSIQGAGVGLDYKNLSQLINVPACDDSYGSEISFVTTGCIPFVGTVGQTSYGASAAATTAYSPPVSLPNLVTQSASLSAKSVTPGTPVTVTADIANKSTVNGNKKVTLYVNGQVETTQGVNVNGGGTSKLTFNVSRSEPGDYTVFVDGIPAGSFKVEMVTGPDAILIFSAILVALAFIAGMVMLWRRQRTA